MRLQQRLRLAGLARSRQAARDQQGRRGRAHLRGGEREIAATLIQALRTRLALELGSADGADLGAHHRPVAQVIGQHPQPGVVATALQPGIQEAPAKRGLTPCLQIHDQKGHIGDDVGPAQFGTELDRIEQPRLAIEHDQVAQMHVAVAFTHPTLGKSGIKGRCERGELRGRPGFHARELGEQGRILHTLADLVEILLHWRMHRSRAAKAPTGLRDRGRGVEIGHVACQAIKQRGLELPRRKQVGEQPGLVEAAHAHQIIDQRGLRSVRASALPCRSDPDPLRCAPHRHHREVDLGQGALIEAQLVLAGHAPPLQSAEIQKPQVERLLQLPRVLTRKQHPGDMRLDQFHAARRVRQHARLHQRVHELVVNVHLSCPY